MIEATYLGAVEADTVFHKPTHIIVYHKDGQEIPYKNILRSLGGQPEQDMVKFSEFLCSGGDKIKIVYQNSLSDSLKANTALPVAEYEVLP
ncbi:hypothetical protein KC19_VG162500 [Ceratodon purpureus]|uniref:Uncharacterized protein n=1 Tax=Ceratodon purpureus TaxID=3225 RepID=A0A8T0HRU4_CERPU|nr:hypothetical protein KC19_VG162500 [Ceratodon purpureus]